jgi:hypothetical protein
MCRSGSITFTSRNVGFDEPMADTTRSYNTKRFSLRRWIVQDAA